jgi:hypothetical protein
LDYQKYSGGNPTAAKMLVRDIAAVGEQTIPYNHNYTELI